VPINRGGAWDFIVPEAATFATKPYRILDELVAIRSKASTLAATPDGLGVQLQQAL
jgi:hypothetical protein